MRDVTEEWPTVFAIKFETPEDASRMASLLNEIFLILSQQGKQIEELRKRVDNIPPHNWQGI